MRRRRTTHRLACGGSILCTALQSSPLCVHDELLRKAGSQHHGGPVREAHHVTNVLGSHRTVLDRIPLLTVFSYTVLVIGRL
jgi:hypothetical protein